MYGKRLTFWNFLLGNEIIYNSQVEAIKGMKEVRFETIELLTIIPEVCKITLLQTHRYIAITTVLRNSYF